MDEDINRRIDQLTDETYLLTYQNDLAIFPVLYAREGHLDKDVLYYRAIPWCSVNWARLAYQFTKQDGMKFDKFNPHWGIDGQPRVSSNGYVWVRLVGPLEDAYIGFELIADQPSHEEAEEQLMEYYGRFRDLDGLSPLEVFSKYRL